MGGGKKAPLPSQESTKDIEKDKRESKKTRAALFETQGGALGEELQPGEVDSRNQTLFGN